MDIKEGVPKIYVACLEAYNSGYLHGVWIDATQEVEQIYKEISEMLKSSPVPNAEEWEIHDSEYMGNTLPEYTSVEEAHERALFIMEYGEDLSSEVLKYTCDIDHAKHMMEECYHGEYDSEEDYARQFYDDCMEIPDHLAYYIDYERIARDMFMSDYVSFRVNGMTHVFHVD
ncbi:MAG: antirestriction protein [Gammaproteobacteria bacterium]|nr:antirestriction protein [Gammaproteobacteria bacterium]